MQHTQACLKAQTERKQLRTAWASAWPNYCQHCEGEGQFVSYYDPSYGIGSLGTGYYTDVELCEQCANKGICARCGKQAWTQEEVEDAIPETPCPFCDWNWDKEI